MSHGSPEKCVGAIALAEDRFQRFQLQIGIGAIGDG